MVYFNTGQFLLLIFLVPKKEYKEPLHPLLIQHSTSTLIIIPGTKRNENPGLKVSYYLANSIPDSVRPRNVSHYNQEFLDAVFKRHHHFRHYQHCTCFYFFNCWLDFLWIIPFFEVPAAASILIFFAAMTAVIGALSYFLQSWSLPVFIIFILVIDVLYKNDIIDTRNKAYGLNYINKTNRPELQ